MRYIDVLWHHNSPDDPTRLVSELDDERYETRKLEFFADGRVGFADALGSQGETSLGEVPVPPIAEINADPEFTAQEMEAETFEALWVQNART